MEDWVWRPIAFSYAERLIAENGLKRCDGDTMVIYEDKRARAVVKSEKRDGEWFFYERK